MKLAKYVCMQHIIVSRGITHIYVTLQVKTTFSGTLKNAILKYSVTKT